MKMNQANDMKSDRRSRHGLMAGFALITGLLFLLIITILSVMMLRSYGLQGRMAGSFREKGRSFEAAQAALQYAEWWLTQGSNATTGANCATVVSSPVVCSNALSSPTSLPWSAGVSYTPAGMSIASNGIAMYAQNPMFYIQYIGVNSTTSTSIYQITAVGYGGNAQTITVLQSTYAIGSSGSGVTSLGK